MIFEIITRVGRPQIISCDEPQLYECLLLSNNKKNTREIFHTDNTPLKLQSKSI